MLKKFTNKKGFTLMEMLIVVAIIVILVAIAIPTMTNQLEKAREATDAANIRALYAEAMVEYMNSDTGAKVTKEYTLTQKEKGWQTADLENNLKKLVKDSSTNYTGEPLVGKTCTITIDTDGTASIKFATA